MARYIDADKFLQDEIKRCGCVPLVGSCTTDNESLAYQLAKASTADVVEVRHGEWQQNPYCKRIYFCSECGRHIEDGSCNPYEHFPYCHCGAKMNGGKNE